LINGTVAGRCLMLEVVGIPGDLRLETEWVIFCGATHLPAVPYVRPTSQARPALAAPDRLHASPCKLHEPSRRICTSTRPCSSVGSIGLFRTIDAERFPKLC
jgi:hypothetical protein